MSHKHQKKFDAFKSEVARADARGIKIMPSVNGPYAYDPKTQTVIGEKGSDAYAKAVADAPLPLSDNPKSSAPRR
jgi:hypothetical protein